MHAGVGVAEEFEVVGAGEGVAFRLGERGTSVFGAVVDTDAQVDCASCQLEGTGSGMGEVRCAPRQ